MDINEMLELQNMGNTGMQVGGAVGAMVGQPIAGAAIGSAIGSAAAALIPSYSHVKGSMSGFNFVKSDYKPYQISLVTPDLPTATAISDWYCYNGCKTSRNEPLNIPSYMYENHAYVKGTIAYNGTIPLDKFNQIKNIFQSGVHILN